MSEHAIGILQMSLSGLSVGVALALVVVEIVARRLASKGKR